MFFFVLKKKISWFLVEILQSKFDVHFSFLTSDLSHLHFPFHCWSKPCNWSGSHHFSSQFSSSQPLCLVALICTSKQKQICLKKLKILPNAVYNSNINDQNSEQIFFRLQSTCKPSSVDQSHLSRLRLHANKEIHVGSKNRNAFAKLQSCLMIVSFYICFVNRKERLDLDIHWLYCKSWKNGYCTKMLSQQTDSLVFESQRQ